MYRKAHITGASGGVVYSRDTALFHRAQAHADRGKPCWRDGFDDRDPGQFLFPALNLHTDEISCAIGLASLARLEETRRRRLAFVAAFAELLGRRSRLCRVHDWSDEDSPFVLPVHVAAGTDARAFGRAVLAEGIGLNPHYRYLAADWPWLRPYLAEDFPTPRARALRDGAFMLYLNENYGSREAEDAVAAIVKVEDWLAAMEGIPWSVSTRVETL
ncbi:MAG: DegT/DnrJ/EryC1/StrS family aminotransferase [Rhodospirillales bacterium]|nr:DegT/DnrJ/EryC1/StrS family aminotransferase [Rhodospirillales bacterium]